MASRTVRRIGVDGSHWEEVFVRYPEEDENYLPTRLGNVMRAAEGYTELRFGADYLLVWPRLAHLCSERFVQSYEISRANVDFLLVISTLSGLFGAAGGVALLLMRAPALLFAAVVLLGFGLARFAYSSAVVSAIEFGEQIRARTEPPGASSTMSFAGATNGSAVHGRVDRAAGTQGPRRVPPAQQRAGRDAGGGEGQHRAAACRGVGVGSASDVSHGGA